MSYELAQQHLDISTQTVKSLWGFDVEYKIITANKKGFKEEVKYKVIKAVTQVYGIDELEFIEQRFRRIVLITDIKKTIFYILRERYFWTFQSIGSEFEMSHATVIYLVAKFKEHIVYDEEFKNRSCEVFKLLGINYCYEYTNKKMYV